MLVQVADREDDVRAVEARVHRREALALLEQLEELAARRELH